MSSSSPLSFWGPLLADIPPTPRKSRAPSCAGLQRRPTKAARAVGEGPPRPGVALAHRSRPITKAKRDVPTQRGQITFSSNPRERDNLPWMSRSPREQIFGKKKSMGSLSGMSWGWET